MAERNIQKIPPSSVFDGFCHRAFNEDTDGWMLEQLDANEVPSVQMAADILDLYQEINELRRENWRLRKDNEMNKKLRQKGFSV